ncbi:Cytochrome P450 [Sesbania bispinosa]|nr:Cytochrome P450 [Sesbania bispinosa]
MLLFLLTCTIIHHVLCSFHARSKKKLPPGPSILTIMRNIFELYNKPQQTLAKLADLYGPIMRVKIGQGTTIMISSADMAKEILQTNDALLSDRTVPDNTTTHKHNQFSLVFLPVSPLWQDLRKICHHNLFSNKTLDGSQDLRRKKLQDLLNDMHKSSLTGDEQLILEERLSRLALISYHTLCLSGFWLKIVDPQGIRRHTSNYVSKVFHVLDHVIDQRLKMRQEKHYVTNNDMLDTLLDILNRIARR